MNAYEQWKASSSSCDFSFLCVFSYILTQVCSLYFSHNLLANSPGLSPNPDLQHFLPHSSSHQQQVPVSCRVHSHNHRGQPGIVSGYSTADSLPYVHQDKPIRVEPRIGNTGPHTDFCSLVRCLCPNLRLTNTQTAAGAMREQ